MSYADNGLTDECAFPCIHQIAILPIQSNGLSNVSRLKVPWKNAGLHSNRKHPDWSQPELSKKPHHCYSVTYPDKISIIVLQKKRHHCSKDFLRLYPKVHGKKPPTVDNSSEGCYSCRRKASMKNEEQTHRYLMDYADFPLSNHRYQQLLPVIAQAVR